MTRVVSGAAGGRALVVPRGGATRPTSDRVREALFSALEHALDLDGASVLDLYAGSGALGLEAASRGAASVLLVDSAAAAVAACRTNAAALGLPGVAVRAGSAAAVLAAGPAGCSGAVPAGGVDLALLDPPYDVDEGALAAVLAALVERGWLAGGALVVVERSRRSPEPTWPPGLVRERERRYGETVLWLAGPQGPGDGAAEQPGGGAGER